MKKKLFTLFMLTIFATNSILANPADSRKRIELKVKHKIERRSILLSPLTAFVTGTLVEINFSSTFRNAIIVISNNHTGEELYYEETSLSENVIIDLYNFMTNCTEYSLYINIDGNTFINGTFTIE